MPDSWHWDYKGVGAGRTTQSTDFDEGDDSKKENEDAIKEFGLLDFDILIVSLSYLSTTTSTID